MSDTVLCDLHASFDTFLVWIWFHSLKYPILYRSFNAALSQHAQTWTLWLQKTESPHDGHHMEADPPAHGHHGQDLLFFYWCPGTSELHLDPHCLQPSVVYFSTPSPEGSISLSKTQVTSMLKYLPDPFLISNCSMALKHQTLRPWGWGREPAVPVSSCCGWAGERSR